jgi:hypothetical protein
VLLLGNCDEGARQNIGIPPICIIFLGVFPGASIYTEHKHFATVSEYVDF